MDNRSAVHKYYPDVVIFSLDVGHMLAGSDVKFGHAEADAFIETSVQRLQGLWKHAKSAFGCQVIQQTLLEVAPSLIGGNEHRLPGSPARLAARLNQRLAEAADGAGVDLLNTNGIGGTATCFDVGLWHGGKQEISPAAAPLYGDLAARLIAAQRGLSGKCLVLDLDNTLWGGVIGDDGLEGIRLGQGSREGESYVSFQKYILDLSRRGVILAVCSKNEEANALLPFEQHPEMLLKRSDIACFVANWDNKASNLRHIAKYLNIGLDALVFADDNPFERNIIRRELPMIVVPELPQDPAYYANCLSDCGAFELLHVTNEDLERSSQYQALSERTALKESFEDIDGYLKSLDMKLYWSEFDELNLKRVSQLINKTNQFNMTTKRYSEPQVLDVISDPTALGLHFRLTDKFGDNGIIGVMIGRLDQRDGAMIIDTMLMSCRVFGRNVEYEMMSLFVKEAATMGATHVVGDYVATPKNGIVSELYTGFGFDAIGDESDGRRRWRLPVERGISGGAFLGESMSRQTVGR
jgi:FkbH-like protein